MPTPPPIADYDSSRVLQTIGDITPTMYGPDTRISITPSGANYSFVQGQDGHIVRIKTRAVTHVVAFTLMKSDPANNLLTEQFYKDLDSDSGSGIKKYQLTDNNGQAKVTASYCWIPQLPDLTYNATGDAVYNWTLQLASADVQTRAMTLLP